MLHQGHKNSWFLDLIKAHLSPALSKFFHDFHQPLRLLWQWNSCPRGLSKMRLRWETFWTWNFKPLHGLEKEPWELFERAARTCQWENVAGGDGGSMLWGQEAYWSKRTHMMVSKHLYSHWDISAVLLDGKEIFWVCCVSWGHSATTISSLLSITASPCCPCGA